MFCDEASHALCFPEDQFRTLVDQGTVVRAEEIYRNKHSGLITRCVFFARPAETWRIAPAKHIQRAMFCGDRAGCTADDVALGRLLGYGANAVRSFVRRTRKARAKKPHLRKLSYR